MPSTQKLAIALLGTVLACASVQRPTLVGSTAPHLALHSAEGQPVELIEDGRPTLLVFFSSWCAPSRHEAPRLVELARRYSARGLRVVGVAVGEVEGDDGVRQFVEQAHVEFPIALATPAAMRAYGELSATPAVFLVGRGGKVEGQLAGMRQMSQLEGMLAALLGPDRTTSAALPAR